MNYSNPFKAKWSRAGNLLCQGHWLITYQDKEILLPLEKRGEDLGTYGIYYFVDPDDPDFAEGLKEEEWVVENVEWLLDLFTQYEIPYDERHLRWFFQAVNLADWRCGSCGGCM